MGRISGFRASIFPTESMSNLNLVANLGLTLFLFIIGLEVDLRFLLSNWKVALNVGVASMVIPFGLGCAIAVGLYNEFKDEAGTVEIDFAIFMLFIGVAMAITVSNTSPFRSYFDANVTGLSRTLSYFNRTEPSHDPSRCDCPLCWRR